MSFCFFLLRYLTVLAFVALAVSKESAPTPSPPPAPSNATFLNVTNCIYLYTRSIRLVEMDNNGGMSYDVKLPPLKEVDPSSSCANGTARQLVFSYKTGLQAPLASVKFTLQFNTTVMGYWKTSLVSVTVKCTSKENCTDLTDTPMDGSWIKAPVGFSYHCTKADPLKVGVTKDNSTNKAGLKVYFEKFQIQPFAISNGQFSTADDCVGFFTIPVLSSLLVTVILAIILAYGLIMISNINTGDRFDDPKGKTIQVSLTD